MNSKLLFYVVIVLTMGVFSHAQAGGHGGGGSGGRGMGGGSFGGRGFAGRGFGDRGFGGRGFGDRGFRHGGFFPDVVVGFGDPYYYAGYYPYYGYDDYSPAPAAYRPAYDSHMSGSESLTVQVQRQLSLKGYYRGDIDGVIGPQTRSAIVAYQREHDLDQSGVIDAHLLKALQL